MSIPITLIIDDPAPLINVYWWHAAEAQETESPTLPSGEAVAQSIPVDFLRQFADVISRRGIKGKFSVLPYPGGLGAIHSSPLARQGFRPTFGPRKILIRKLAAKITCVATIPIAQIVMNWFIGCRWANVL